MPNQFSATIDSFIFQANDLLVQYRQLQGRAGNFKKNPVRDFLSEVGGAVGQDLFASRTGRLVGKAVTRAYLENQESTQLSNEDQRLNLALSILLAGVRSFLSSISIPRAGLRPSGNSDLLLRRLRKVDESMKFGTKIRRLVSVLQGIREEPLIYNTSIGDWLEKQRRREVEEGRHYKTMQELETRLRTFISLKLAAISSNWWIERVPEDVRKRAEERKSKNERLYPWQSELGLQPIHFVDFPDYAKVILRKDNWNHVFSSTFKDKEIISSKLREIEPIRNAIAHFRKLSRSQEEKLELYAADILGSL